MENKYELSVAHAEAYASSYCDARPGIVNAYAIWSGVRAGYLQALTQKESSQKLDTDGYELRKTEHGDSIACSCCGVEDVPTKSFRKPAPDFENYRLLCHLCANTSVADAMYYKHQSSPDHRDLAQIAHWIVKEIKK